MNTFMNSFFEEELAALQSAKREFLEKFPNAEIDLNTEMLLNGFATLTARLRKDMAETENKIARGFIEKVSPELLKPISSRTLVEIVPSASDNLIREISAGARLQEKASGTILNSWQVTQKHKLNPVQKILSIKAVEDSESFDCLEIEGEGIGDEGTEYIIYVNSWELWYYLLKYAKIFSAKPYNAKPFIIAKPKYAWELCRDFFTFEEKFRFIYANALPKKIRFDKKLPRHIFSGVSGDSLKLRVFPVEHIIPELQAELPIRRGGRQEDGLNKLQGAECENLEFLVKDESLYMCSVRALLKPTPFMNVPNKQNLEWAILAILQKNYLGFFERDVLAEALQMYLWNHQGKRNFLAHSIRKASCEIGNSVFMGSIVPQANIKIIMQCEIFTGNDYEFLGVINAFGEMLFYLFGRTLPCNLKIALTLRIEPFGMEMSFL